MVSYFQKVILRTKTLRYFPIPHIFQNQINVLFKLKLYLLLWILKNLGEHVNDTFEIDFGNNKFPYYLGNRKTKSVDEETNDQEVDSSTLSVKAIR